MTDSLPFFKVGHPYEVAPAALEALLNPGSPWTRSGESEPCLYVNGLRFMAAPLEVYKRADAGDPTPENLWLATECEWREEVGKFPRTAHLVKALFNDFGGERLGAVLVMRLPRGQYVKPHADSGLYTEYYERLYIPLLCDPGNTFTVGSHEFYCAPGEVWTGDFKREHSARNGSERDRYILVVDLKR